MFLSPYEWYKKKNFERKKEEEEEEEEEEFEPMIALRHTKVLSKDSPKISYLVNIIFVNLFYYSAYSWALLYYFY